MSAFIQKRVAVDATGVRRVHGGDIGDVLPTQTTYNTGSLWQRGRGRELYEVFGRSSGGATPHYNAVFCWFCRLCRHHATISRRTVRHLATTHGYGRCDPGCFIDDCPGH